MKSRKSVLQAIFSEIYPFSIEVTHGVSFYDKLTYYCVSPLFEELDEAECAPEYLIEIIDNPDEPPRLGKVSKADTLL